MKLKRIVYPLALLLFVIGCKEDEIAPVETDAVVKNNIVAIMNNWYFWNEDLPSNIDVNAFDTPEALITSLRNPLDRWSGIREEVAFDQYYVAAKFVGLGFSMQWVSETELRVSLVYKDSPADQSGLKRGMEITKVNGVDLQNISDFGQAFGANEVGVKVTLTVRNSEGTVEDLEMTKNEVDITTVPYRSVIEQGNSKVGYFVFNNFIERSKNDIDETFDYFASEGIDELILDLRYNGGGLLNIATYLSSIIAPASAQGNLMLKMAFNEDRVENDSTINFQETPYNFEFDKVMIITTGSSASASEAVINALKPFMEVKTVGDDSYGKPVGASGFRFEGYVFTPITFKLINADGVAEYFDGIPADSKVPDGLTYDFGDVNETCLKEALHYIETGTFGSSGARMAAPRVVEKNKSMYKGMNEEIGAF